MRIKVCGMKDPKNMQEVAGLAPDYLGFIFYNKSPRFFNGQIPQLPKNIKRVGVFVASPIPKLIEIVKTHKLNVVQLHGEESAEYITKLKQELPKTVHIWKVFAVSDHFNFELLKEFEGKVDAFLFDTKGPAPGGNGFAFNWNVLGHYNSKTPFVISGGIGLNELQQLKALNATKLPVLAVDVNSKFEIIPGLKNIEDLKKLVTYEL